MPRCQRAVVPSHTTAAIAACARPNAASRANETDVRTEPDDAVDRLDRRLRNPAAASAGGDDGAGERQRHAGDHEHDADEGQEPDVLVQADTEEAEAEVRAEAGESRRRVERVRGPTLAPPVHRSDDLADSEEHDADHDARDEEPHRIVERDQPEGRQGVRRAEHLTVRNAESRRGNARGDSDGPTGSEPSQEPTAACEPTGRA